MKITNIECLYIDKGAYVLIDTSEGIRGVGEIGNWGYLDAAISAVYRMKEYLLGKKPLEIENHWQSIYRAFIFRGSTIMGALGAIDVALWDIAGKYYGVPTYKLLGGGDKVRNKIRAYYHVKSPSVEQHFEKIKEAKAKGYTAVGHINPFLDKPRNEVRKNTSHYNKLTNAIDNVYKFREFAGDDTDICLELHRRLTTSEAITLAKEIEGAKPYFYEDPIMPDCFLAMKKVSDHINIPIATGERLININEFNTLMSYGAMQHARVPVAAIGGLTYAKKIATVAEVYGVKIAPHNPLSSVSTAACLQLCASIPNASILEIPVDEDSIISNKVFKKDYSVENGHLKIPSTPGIGIDIDFDKAKAYPFKTRVDFTIVRSEDGLVIDK